MKKHQRSLLFFKAALWMLFISFQSYAQDYTITFTGKNTSDQVDSVVVQNLTLGLTVVVPAGNSLNLRAYPTSVDQPSENDQPMRVFTNQERDESIVSFIAKRSGSTQITVFGMDGKTFIEKSKHLSAGENSFQLSLPKGVYAIRIAGNGFSYTTKVIGQANTGGEPVIDFIEKETSISPKISDIVSLRSSDATTYMVYTIGDHLLFKGVSGHCKTMVADVPTQSKTISFNFVDCTDADNNHYPVIQIGTQVWMVENLRTTKYSNGESIETTTPANKDITSEVSPKYQWAYNNDESNVSKFGRLYTWYVVNDNRHLAPAGWHVASNDEWITLENYLIANGYNFDGSMNDNKIAQSLAATTYWKTSTGVGNPGRDLGLNNTSGFSALPSGCRLPEGTFDDIENYGFWWSITEGNVTSAWVRSLFNNTSYLNRGNGEKSEGLSVRCVKD